MFSITMYVFFVQAYEKPVYLELQKHYISKKEHSLFSPLVGECDGFQIQSASHWNYTYRHALLLSCFADISLASILASTFFHRHVLLSMMGLIGLVLNDKIRDKWLPKNDHNYKYSISTHEKKWPHQLDCYYGIDGLTKSGIVFYNQNKPLYFIYYLFMGYSDRKRAIIVNLDDGKQFFFPYVRPYEIEFPFDSQQLFEYDCLKILSIFSEGRITLLPLDDDHIVTKELSGEPQEEKIRPIHLEDVTHLYYSFKYPIFAIKRKNESSFLHIVSLLSPAQLKIKDFTIKSLACIDEEIESSKQTRNLQITKNDFLTELAENNQFIQPVFHSLYSKNAQKSIAEWHHKVSKRNHHFIGIIL